MRSNNGSTVKFLIMSIDVAAYYLVLAIWKALWLWESLALGVRNFLVRGNVNLKAYVALGAIMGSFFGPYWAKHREKGVVNEGARKSFKTNSK